MKFMRLAVSLAKKSNPSPNPRVGAVIVKKGRLIGKGYHKKAGMPHAEIEAIRDAERKGFGVKDATLYLTLEPCCHTRKRTPPCTKAIIAKKFSRVVCAMRDPNPLVSGKGIRELRNKGIAVEVGMLEKEAEETNRDYIKAMRKGVPYVAVKMAVSLDGKVAAKTGKSKWISSKRSREFVHKLRSEFDGVMVGVGTVLADNPSLTCRLGKTRKNPAKIIVDSRLRTPLNSKLFSSGRIIFLTTKNYSRKKRDAMEKRGVEFVVSGNKKVSLGQAFRKLPGLGVLSILAEGGGELNGSLFQEKLVDHIYFFAAPKIIGGRDAKTPVAGSGVESPEDAIAVRNMKTKRIGEDLLIEGDPCY